MLITTETPDTWQDLEEAVARILTRSGLQAERGRVVETVRGRAEIDVHATQPVGRRTFTILCECKHWSARVPQTIVHSFRTVMSDVGADRGYIISTEGFQAGAEEAARLSNVRLLNWPEFQEEFEEDYYEFFVREELERCLKHLFYFTEPISPASFLAGGRLEEERIPEFLALKEQYSPLTFACLPMAPAGVSLPGAERLRLPLRRYVLGEAADGLPDELLDIEAWDQFLELLCPLAERACEEFRALLRPAAQHDA